MNRKKEMRDVATDRTLEILSEFKNLAIKRFKWTNLPNGLTSDILEDMLITKGVLGGFINSNNELTILPLHGVGGVNIYNQHVTYMLTGYNGKTYELPIDDVCKLKNNPTETNDMDTLDTYASRINDIERTQEVNLFQMNIPKMISTTRDGVLTAKNIVNKLKEFKLVIFTRENGINKQIKQEDILDTSVPFLLDKLGDYENFYRNKILTYLAINNANTDKKERLISNEVDANNDLLYTMLDMMYEERKEFCDNVKEKFGIQINVEKRRTLDGTLHSNGTTNN